MKVFVSFLFTLDLNQVNPLALKIDFSYTQCDGEKNDHLKRSANKMQSNRQSFKSYIFYTICWQLNSVTIRLANTYLSKCKEYKLPDSAIPDWLYAGTRTPSNIASIWGQGMGPHIQFSAPPQSGMQRHKTL
jgi:hypothetical protein